jgi:iron(III) transport system ATP-binding protein
VASFLGGTNLVPGTASGDTARTELGELPLMKQATGPVLLSLRPEALRLVPPTEVAPPGAPSVQVLGREFQGHGVTFTVAHGGKELTVRGAPELPFHAGDKTRLEVVGKAVVLEDAP